MKSPLIIPVALTLALAPVGAASAQETDQNEAAEFLQEEANVVTPSRQPTTAREAPATTYIVTADDIKLSGAATLFDVLRLVPGVDVIAQRDTQGDVAIRGLDMASNNRVLIMLDGKTVLDAYFDSLDWETIPVGVAEIDHIEVVEGPASALYGGNAESGVINIITKKPEQIDGAVATYTGGSAGTNLADAVVGKKDGAVGYRLGAGWRSFDRLNDPSHAASDAGRIDGLLQWQPADDRGLSVSGGLVRHNSQVFGPPSGAFDDGETGFLRTDGQFGKTTGRFFWNAGRTSLTDLTELGGPTIDYDTFDATLQHPFHAAESNDLTVNAEWRRNQAASSIFDGSVGQNLYSGAFEDRWRPREDLSVVTGARLDHHPLAGWMFSPRGSAIWDASPAQTLRVSAGQAFRYPTLLENYANFTTPVLPNGAQAEFFPSPNLRPERVITEELAWRGEFQTIRAAASVFHYELTNLINAQAALVSAGPPPLFQAAEANQGGVRAVGYELGAEEDLASHWIGFANYSYQSIGDEQSSSSFSVSSPKHKGNAGIRYKSSRWSAQLWLNAVDQTIWSGAPDGEVPAYAILNATVFYRFAGRWQGLELGLSAFNLTDNQHYEILRFQDPLEPGQGGEHERGRYMATASYRF